MGLFTKENCALCGKKVGLFKTKIKDNQKLCSNCQALLDMDNSMLPNQSVNDIKEHLEFRKNNKIKYDSFKITRNIKTATTSFYVDDEKKQWYLSSGIFTINPTIFKFSDIIDYEITEDGESISKGGLGRAVAGGVLFGATGAIVGGITGKKTTKNVVKEMTLRISLKHKYRTSYTIPLMPLGTECKVGSITYKSYKQTANDLTSLFDYMCSQSEEPTPTTIIENTTSSADEIKKFKELLDEGIISQEEFDAKKKQLLGL